MARYDKINVYVASRSLLLYFFEISKKFTRDYKYTMGETIKKELCDLLLIIYSGIPIGNLTSQLFSNIYLNDFDHYMKRTLGLKHYGRYVDDFFVVHNDKEYLKEIIQLSKDYLAKHLELKLHPKKIYLQPIEKGISYLGGFIKPFCINVDKRTRQKVSCRFQEMHKHNKEGSITVADVLKYRATINSYLGILSHYRAFNLKKELLSKYPFPYTYGYYLLHNRRCRFIISKLEVCVDNHQKIIV